jgi:hypothetical protein
VGALLVAQAPAAISQPVDPAVNANAAWILKSVLSSGAIQVYPDNPAQRIEPYFGNYAAMGLARAAVLTGNHAYAAASWNWLAWYAGHEGSNGVVTVYTVNGGVETSTGDEDSTDSYAGTFLSAAAMAFPLNPSRLATLAGGIHGAITAILATQDTDGLTWAKPSYAVKYLMDNGEAYDGLIAAVHMELALGDARWAAVAATAAKAMYNGIQTLWNPRTATFNWAKFPGGGTQTTNWAVLYPDAMEQASAVAFHVAGSHGSSLISQFNAHQPSWAAPAIVGYQALAALGQESGNGTIAGLNGATAINQSAIATSRAWPFNVSTAGELIFAVSGSALVGA